MANYIVSTDSGCDLSYEFCKEKNIVPINMKYIVDETEYTDMMDPKQIKGFYDIMREGKIPHTTQLNDADFTNFWEPMLKEGNDIIHLCMSSGISGTYANGLKTAEKLMQKYPDRKVKIVDTKMTSTGTGLVAIECAKARDNGATFDECLALAEKNSLCVYACFTTDDITYLHRGGRVSTVGMIFSKALHIYPVMHVNPQGELKVFAKSRGVKDAWNTVAKYIEDNCVNPEEQTLYLSDADNPEELRKLGDMLMERFHFKDVFYSNIGTIIGAHTGPGLLTLFFLGNPRK